MELSKSNLNKILENRRVEELDFTTLRTLFEGEDKVKLHAPSGKFSVDPRTNDRVVYSEARTRRPHDTVSEVLQVGRDDECIICQGKTTGVIDFTPLSEGFTFINKNLFPAVFLHENNGKKNEIASGYHFLQWTSSVHGMDWHNMRIDDLAVVMKRLGALEEKLLSYGKYQHVIIIKNYGRQVGGSLTHGHQQILWTNIKPGHFEADEKFAKERGTAFCEYMLNENPESLVVKDYGKAILVVPFFMKRPLDMMLFIKDTKKFHIYQLNDREIFSVVEAFKEATASIMKLMPLRGRKPAYNIVTHNSHSGLYFEFLPFTQEMGGLEKLGFYICEGNPESIAAELRDAIGEKQSR